MALEKNDFKQIEKIVSGTEKRLGEGIDGLEKKFREEISKSEERLSNKISRTEERIITNINREISDLADINRAVIIRTDQLDYRLRIVERKLGLSVK